MKTTIKLISNQNFKMLNDTYYISEKISDLAFLKTNSKENGKSLVKYILKIEISEIYKKLVQDMQI